MQGNQNAKHEKNSGDYGNGCSNEQPRGNTSRYHLARLKRDHPDIARALADGKYRSVRAAAKAGLVHESTPLATLHRVWRKVSSDDQARFLIEMLTPAQRRCADLHSATSLPRGRGAAITFLRLATPAKV
jgi:hypothetical protein